MDGPSEGRPTSVVTEKNVSTVEILVKQDRRIIVKQLAIETRISVGSVEKILLIDRWSEEREGWLLQTSSLARSKWRLFLSENCNHGWDLDLSIQSRAEKRVYAMEKTLIAPTKESKGHTIKWQGHAVSFLGLWGHHNDWLHGKGENNPCRVLFRVTEKTEI